MSSFDSALAARLWHSPPRRRASVASAASSRAPAAAPRRALSARPRICETASRTRCTEHLERAQAHSLSRPRPAPETPLHPPGRRHVRAGHVRLRVRFVVRNAGVRPGRALRVSSRTVSSCSATRRSSSAPKALESVELTEASVERPQASVSCCSTRHTLSDATDARARLASRGALGVRRPALAGELGPASSLSRVRSLSSDEGASEGSARARDRAKDRPLSTPCDCRTRKILARCCEGGVATKGDTGGGAPFGALDPRAFLPRLASRHRDVTLPREHLGAASSDERDSSNIPTGCAFVPNKVESAHVLRPIGALQLWYRRSSGIFALDSKTGARGCFGKRFFFRLEKNDARPGTRFFFRQSAHRASA